MFETRASTSARWNLLNGARVEIWSFNIDYRWFRIPAAEIFVDHTPLCWGELNGATHSWQKERVTAHLVDFKSVGAALQPSLHPYNPPPLSPILCRPDGKTHFVASNLSNSQWKENLYDFSSPGIRVRFTTKATNQKCSNFNNNIKGAKFSENLESNWIFYWS